MVAFLGKVSRYVEGFLSDGANGQYGTTFLTFIESS